MNKPFPVFCRDCRFSEPERDASWNLKCKNPIVNARDEWALASSAGGAGTSCKDERRVIWFAACGRKGKLWEPK